MSEANTPNERKDIKTRHHITIIFVSVSVVLAIITILNIILPDRQSYESDVEYFADRNYNYLIVNHILIVFLVTYVIIREIWKRN